MKTVLSLLGLCLILAACSKPEQGTAFDCTKFKTGLAAADNATISLEVNKLCADLYPNSISSADEYGQAQNINLLVQRLSAQCDVTATLVCYSCVETLPAQSEIRVTFNLNGIPYDRTLDISVTPQNMLTFVNAHE